MHPRLQNGLSAIIRLFWFVSEAVLKYTWGNYDISILKLQVLFAAEYALALLGLHCTHSLQCSLPVVYSKLNWHNFYVPISPWCMYCFCLGYLLHFLHSLIRLHLVIVSGAALYLLLAAVASFCSLQREDGLAVIWLAWGCCSLGLSYVVELLMALMSYHLPALLW